MNQIAAALLILSASVCSYTATIRPTNEGFGGILGLVALGLGLWGGMSLLTSTVRDRERALESLPSLPSLGSSAVNGLRSLTAGTSRDTTKYDSSRRDYHLSPEVEAQVRVAAQMRGQNRNQVVEETLRRHLPKSPSSRVA